MPFSVDADIKIAARTFHVNALGLREFIAGPVERDLVRRAVKVERLAKQYATGFGGGPNVRTGRLRNSITWRPGRDSRGPYVDIGSNVHYCIFGAGTHVTTERGHLTIGQVQPGDRVLTSAGDFQNVVAKTVFPALEKPELVDIVVPWRQGREHRLTLTVDHKVLCYREGRNQWVPAGDLRDGDMLYDRAKAAHNHGSGPLKTCEECGRRHKGQGRRYCSLACRDAAWAAGANPHLGAVRADATREKIRRHAVASGSGIRLNRELAQRGFKTSCEREVEDWLIARDVPYETQVVIGGCVVDFFLPQTREVVEADGAYWHRDQERDIERDRQLLAAAGGIEITHMHFFDKRFSPEPLVTEPLPGVRYVACNPGPASFVDPTVFRRMPVRIERLWTYGVQKAHTKDPLNAGLYDLAVENVESFLANGVIVSNSAFVELGTRRMRPRPYLRPALLAARD